MSACKHNISTTSEQFYCSDGIAGDTVAPVDAHPIYQRSMNDIENMEHIPKSLALAAKMHAHHDGIGIKKTSLCTTYIKKIGGELSSEVVRQRIPGTQLYVDVLWSICPASSPGKFVIGTAISFDARNLQDIIYTIV